MKKAQATYTHDQVDKLINLTYYLLTFGGTFVGLMSERIAHYEALVELAGEKDEKLSIALHAMGCSLGTLDAKMRAAALIASRGKDGKGENEITKAAVSLAIAFQDTEFEDTVSTLSRLMHTIASIGDPDVDAGLAGFYKMFNVDAPVELLSRVELMDLKAARMVSGVDTSGDEWMPVLKKASKNTARLARQLRMAAMVASGSAEVADVPSDN